MTVFKIFFSPEIIWFIVGLILMLAEYFVPGFVMTLFGVGAWITAVLIMLIPGITISLQLFIFIVASIVLLLALQKHLAKFFRSFEKKSNTAGDNDDFIGHRTTVIQPIGKSKKGTVEFHGVLWKAAANREIGEGQIVEIIGKDRNILKVKLIE